MFNDGKSLMFISMLPVNFFLISLSLLLLSVSSSFEQSIAPVDVNLWDPVQH